MELNSTLQKEAEGGEARATTASILSGCADASSDWGLEECLPYPVLSDTILSDLSLSLLGLQRDRLVKMMEYF